ncbi:Fe-S cluster assembly protein HesB [Pseudactinotalea sp. HY160]|uniref:HhH-GPD-type base excision DNA repair protein n=1 Tax=Pseudactinotalea sp. HY160 TaxID=2654490 RepID=UPI00128D0163|nr:HhH-GPD-type base excision DNA repair protein [Pseudactinotalea sp. HY160]MPV50179.1 Fe-S cluster assembly protein HesB [Pseudactinotalea sp. HY160]
MSAADFYTGDPDADRLLAADNLALLLGMVLDQQVMMETAFAGPAKLADRLGGLDPAQIAHLDPEEFKAVCATPPAVHRFPGSMAARLQGVCAAIVADWGGEAGRLWTDGEPDGAEVYRRLRALPGFGDQKARVFLALLGKRRGLTAPGWREAAGDYGPDEAYLSIADVRDEHTLARVRENKKAVKAAAKARR